MFSNTVSTQDCTASCVTNECYGCGSSPSMGVAPPINTSVSIVGNQIFAISSNPTQRITSYTLDSSCSMDWVDDNINQPQPNLSLIHI